MSPHPRSPALAKYLAAALLCLWAAACASPRSSYAAEEIEKWEATGNTALSVTGNVTFTSSKIAFQSGAAFPLASAGHVKDFKAMGESVDAAVYRVTTPADPALKNGNHLCGSGTRTRSVSYIAIWKPEALPGDKSPRAMAAFSSKDEPHAAGGPDFCGIYNYDSDK
ncbi:MAG: hypothetical protein WDO73_23940 [Ignavibacteriota bacterium]